MSHPRTPILVLLAANKTHPLRRARLLTARRYGWASVPRRAALQGFHDGGVWVRSYSGEMG